MATAQIRISIKVEGPGAAEAQTRKDIATFFLYNFPSPLFFQPSIKKFRVEGSLMATAAVDELRISGQITVALKEMYDFNQF